MPSIPITFDVEIDLRFWGLGLYVEFSNRGEIGLLIGPFLFTVCWSE